MVRPPSGGEGAETGSGRPTHSPRDDHRAVGRACTQMRLGLEMGDLRMTPTLPAGRARTEARTQLDAFTEMGSGTERPL